METDKKNLFISTNSSGLSVTINGDNNSEAVLLLHGGPGVPDYLDEVASSLNRNFMTIQFDQRGVGKSKLKNSRYHIDDYLLDINAILDHLNISKVHLFGHSWGGLLALLYATNNVNRINSLFLCSPSSGVGDVWNKMEREVMRYNKNQSSGSEWLSMGLNSLWGAMGFDFGYKKVFANVWRYYFKEPKSISKPGENWLEGIDAKAINETRKNIINYDSDNFIKKIQNINIPTLLSYGRFDIYGASKTEIINNLKNAELFEFENAGHLPWIQDKNTFKKIIDEFYFTNT